jgi:MHS family shikimate/dehydroshikimate transporter-like MFS transporter
MARTFVLDAIALATFIELFMMPLSGWLSDLIGRRTLYLIGTTFGILVAFPLFWLLGTRDPTIVLWTPEGAIADVPVEAGH